MSRAACVIVFLFNSFLSMVSYADEAYSQSEISEINRILSTQACATECSFRLPSYDHYGRQGTIALTNIDFDVNADGAADYILSTPVHCGSSGCLKALLVSHDGYLHKVLESRNIDSLLSDHDALRRAWADKLNALGTRTALVAGPHSNIDIREPDASAAASCNRGVSTTAANLLFTQASLKHRDAQARSGDARRELYVEVVALLDSIVRDYRDTDLACRIASAGTLGAMNVTEMRMAVVSPPAILLSESPGAAPARTYSGIDVGVAVLLHPGESSRGVTFSPHGEISIGATKLFQASLRGVSNFDYFYLRVYERGDGIRIVELYEVAEDLSINADDPLLGSALVSARGHVLEQDSLGAIPPFIEPADRAPLSRLLVQMPYLRVASLNDILPLHPVEQSILGERHNGETPFYVTGKDLNKNGFSDFAVILKDTRPSSDATVLAIFHGPILPNSQPAYINGTNRFLSESLVYYDEKMKMLRVGKLESENAVVVLNQVGGYKILFPSEMENDVSSTFAEDKLIAEGGAEANAFTWDYRDAPDFVVLPGDTTAGFSLEQNGTAYYKDQLVFGVWQSGNGSDFRLQVFRAPRGESVVVLYSHQDFGAVRIGIIDMAGTRILNNKVTPFSRWGPSKLAFSPDGAYAALAFPTGEFTSELGVFETATGRFALHQSTSPDPDVFFTPELRSLELQESGVLRLRQTRWGYDSYWLPEELGAEVVQIMLPELLSQSTDPSDKLSRPWAMEANSFEEHDITTGLAQAQSSATSNVEANQLFVEAVMLYRQATALPEEEASERLIQVRRLFDRILANHPDSLPSQAIRGGGSPGGVDLAALPPSLPTGWNDGKRAIARDLLNAYGGKLAELERVADYADYAVLASAAYGGEEVIELARQRGWREHPRSRDGHFVVPRVGGVGDAVARLFISDRGEAVLSFRGTDTVADWLTNIGTVQPVFWDQLRSARVLADRALAIHSDVSFVGHSLGGAMAQMARLHTGQAAVIFNSAPLGFHALSMAISGELLNSQVRSGLLAVRSPEDPLREVSESISGFEDAVVRNIALTDNTVFRNVLDGLFGTNHAHTMPVLAWAMHDARLARDEGWLYAYLLEQTGIGVLAEANADAEGTTVVGDLAADHPRGIKKEGAFAFPQAKATVLFDTKELRVSAWNDAAHLYVQAVLWTDGHDTLGKAEDGRMIGDGSSLVVDTDADGKVTPNVDRSYSLNPLPHLPGLRYQVKITPFSSTALQHDSKGRGSIQYVETTDGKVRVDSFVIPLAEIGRKAGEKVRFAYYGSSPKPEMRLNSIGYKPNGANYYPHDLPWEMFHELTLADRPATFDLKKVPDGRDEPEKDRIKRLRLATEVYWKETWQKELEGEDPWENLTDLLRFDRAATIAELSKGRHLSLTFASGKVEFVQGKAILSDYQRGTDIYEGIPDGGFSWEGWFDAIGSAGKQSFTVVCRVAPDELVGMSEGSLYVFHGRLHSVTDSSYINQVVLDCVRAE